MVAPGLLYPLVALRDQLTQSVLLLMFALSAALALLLKRFDWRAAQQTWRAILVSTYALAALHKLNVDFLDPAVSCATYGWQEIERTWHLEPLAAPLGALLYELLPALVIATEALIAALYLARFRRLAWALALAFHLPLTLTMAPAFAFVMLAGHAAWCEPRDLEQARELWTTRRAKGAAVAALSAIGAAASVALARHAVEWSAAAREALLWALFGLSLSWPGAQAFLDRQPSPLKEGVSRLTIIALALFWLNGLSPYTGRQVQHAGAMLSNLRVDEGCWNSLLVPEAARLSDDYIRVEEVYFNAAGVDPEYEALLREHLWSPPQLRQMQRNWCAPRRRPLLPGRELAQRGVRDRRSVRARP